MSEKEIKCNKCGEQIETHETFCKGSNNTKWCKKCGANICFICGKKETKKEWRESYDCCNNCKMVEVEVEMFGQWEKEENNPNERIWVHYCDEHKAEAAKSSYLMTKAEVLSYVEWEEQERKEKEAQKKREQEKKLNNQRNLFRCEGRTD